MLDEELNLLWPGFLGMVFYILIAFHINLTNSKCCTQHTYANFFTSLLTFLTLWESQWSVDKLWKNYYIFLRLIDINNRFNVRSTIKYYNVIHIKSNIYEVEGKGNYFRLATLKTVHPNDREFCSYDIAGTLDKRYVLAGNHSFVKSGQHIIFF